MIYDEILDVVSNDDIVIGKEKRSIIYSEKLNFRVINGFVCNSEKNLWIPRRHPNKKLFPLALDASVGGHVSAGETYEEAFIRETQEELGIDVSTCQYKKIARLDPIKNGTSAFMWVYIIYTDQVPAYNQNDFIDYNWMNPEEICKKISDGDKAKSDLIIIINEIKDKL